MGNAKVDPSVIFKGVETLNNLSKIGANLSKPQTERKPRHEGDSTNTNQPHTQTVEVKVGEQGGQKPVVIHDKKETHIHKPFPDARELSEKECEVEILRLKLEAEAKKDEIEYRRWVEEENRRERKERDEAARRDRENRRAEDKRLAKRVFFGAAIAAAVGVGLYAYDTYSSSRRSGARRLYIPQPKASLTISTETSSSTAIPAEGSVE